jgi:hypothetical protein
VETSYLTFYLEDNLLSDRLRNCKMGEICDGYAVVNRMAVPERNIYSVQNLVKAFHLILYI